MWEGSHVKSLVYDVPVDSEDLVTIFVLAAMEEKYFLSLLQRIRSKRHIGLQEGAAIFHSPV